MNARNQGFVVKILVIDLTFFLLVSSVLKPWLVFLNHFMSLISFFTLWGHKKNFWLSHFFRGFRKRPMACNGLMNILTLYSANPTKWSFCGLACKGLSGRGIFLIDVFLKFQDLLLSDKLYRVKSEFFDII